MQNPCPNDKGRIPVHPKLGNSRNTEKHENCDVHDVAEQFHQIV